MHLKRTMRISVPSYAVICGTRRHDPATSRRRTDARTPGRPAPVL